MDATDYYSATNADFDADTIRPGLDAFGLLPRYGRYLR